MITSGFNSEKTTLASASSKGRFPANIILDEEAGKMLDEQSGELKSGNRSGNHSSVGNLYGKYGDKSAELRSSTGGASRFFYCAKASKSERGENNNHPTVKPLALMRYLCTLTKTPTGGIVLDPFCGSGSTLMAAKETGRDFIGIEREQEYVDIAQGRVDNMPMKLL